MKRLEISNGGFALVDDEDYEKVNRYSWRKRKKRRDKTYYLKATVNGKSTRLHRFIMNPDDEELIDHINGNGLDNRKENLRIVNHKQNCQNRRPRKNTKSKYKGVSYHKRDKKYYAYINVDGERIHLGYCDTEEEAARKYNEAAKEYFGKYAYFNKI